MPNLVGFTTTTGCKEHVNTDKYNNRINNLYKLDTGQEAMLRSSLSYLQTESRVVTNAILHGDNYTGR